MRSARLLLLLLSSLAIASPPAGAGSPESMAGDLRVGAAAIDITPPDGVPMAGYYHIRTATGVHDPLQVKAIVIETEGERAALVALDLITVTRELVEEAREAVEAETGIPGSQVMISATHAHTGPVLPDPSPSEQALGGDSPAAAEYARTLPSLIARSVGQALHRAGPASVRGARGHEETLAFNRRFHMKDGGFGWNPGKGNSLILRPAGPIDADVPVIAFEGPSGERRATYVNYALHLDTVGGLQISADYPYTLARSLAAIHGEETVTVFTLGCAGDINHLDVAWDDPQKGHAEAARIGTVLAGAVVETLPRLRPMDPGPLQVRSEMVALDLAPVSGADVAEARRTLEKGTDDRAVPFLEIVKAYQVLDVLAFEGKPVEAEVQVITLGRDVAWVGFPGEVFVELGIALKRASPFRHTIVSELTGGSIGYVPTRHAYTQGQYEVISARVAAGSGERLVETASRMLRELFAAASAEGGGSLLAREKGM